VTLRPSWTALGTHQQQAQRLHLSQLFAEDPGRGERMAVDAEGIYLDYSKNRVNDETLRLLTRLAVESGLRNRIDAMFRGDRISITENRAATSTRWRRSSSSPPRRLRRSSP
jgi:glucose-6-phosphate isomerase